MPFQKTGAQHHRPERPHRQCGTGAPSLRTLIRAIGYSTRRRCPMSQTSAITPRLVALATAEPPHDILQEEIAERAARYFSSNEGGYQWLLPIYHNAEIRRRHSVV